MRRPKEPFFYFCTHKYFQVEMNEEFAIPQKNVPLSFHFRSLLTQKGIR
jgi:hypothetical protein